MPSEARSTAPVDSGLLCWSPTAAVDLPSLGDLRSRLEAVREAMSGKLILLGEKTIEYPLTAFNTLGRHPDNSIQVLDRIVSKEHARITLAPNGRWVVRDAGSHESNS